MRAIVLCRLGDATLKWVPWDRCKWQWPELLLCLRGSVNMIINGQQARYCQCYLDLQGSLTRLAYNHIVNWWGKWAAKQCLTCRLILRRFVLIRMVSTTAMWNHFFTSSFQVQAVLRPRFHCLKTKFYWRMTLECYYKHLLYNYSGPLSRRLTRVVHRGVIRGCFRSEMKLKRLKIPTWSVGAGANNSCSSR